MYAIPQPGKQLGLQPRLADWDAAGHPSQIRLEKFLSGAEKVCRPQLDQLADPLALRLDVGLAGTTPLLDQHDLDNYLFPLSTRLTRATGRAFVSVWGIKRHSPNSRLGVTAAIHVQADSRYQVFVVRTTASSGTTAFKQQIDQQVTGTHVFPDGPLQLHIGFVVGPRRHWPNLWKPTIDAPSKILGRTAPNRPWHPLDGRIDAARVQHTHRP